MTNSPSKKNQFPFPVQINIAQKLNEFISLACLETLTKNIAIYRLAYRTYTNTEA